MRAQTTRVGVNLLTCNLAQYPLHYQATEYAIKSLLESDLRQYEWQLQVVDNGSTCPQTQTMLERLEGEHPQIFVSRQWENVGIARGRNLGYQQLVSRSAVDYVVEIHNDHFFPEMWLDPLIKFLEAHPQVGMVGPGLFTNGGFWHGPKLAVAYQRDGHNLAPYEVFKRELERCANVQRRPAHVCPGLSHPAVMRWSMVEALGERDEQGTCVYDPLMPGNQNFEDTELAFRVHKAGWQVLMHHGSYVYHHYHFSRLDVGNHPADYDANNNYCQLKHGPEFIIFATATMGDWMTKAYRR